MAQKRINIIVAASKNRGIGVDGKIPWHLRGDMKFFKHMTTETKDKEKQNVVIMGRKTYFSIPEKYRPLDNRINIILSRDMSEPPVGTHLAKNFQEALDMSNRSPIGDKVENIYVIGGSSVYQEAFKVCDRIYLTQVLADFHCDTFLPEFDQSKFQLVEDPEVESEVQTEKDLSYKFEVYDKMKEPACECASPPYFNVVVAMEQNRGIAFGNSIPWPSLKTDYEHYTKISAHVTNPENVCVNIKGRMTWDDSQDAERNHPNRRSIILSKTLRECPEKAECLKTSLTEALEYCAQEPFCQKVESIWVLGGQNIYQEAMKHPLCKRIYITRIFKTFECDRFLDEFENDGTYRKIQDKYVRDDIIEENGVPYQFEVYERV